MEIPTATQGDDWSEDPATDDGGQSFGGVGRWRIGEELLESTGRLTRSQGMKMPPEGIIHGRSHFMAEA